MRLFRWKSKLGLGSVRCFGVVENGFVIWCDVQKKWQNNYFLSASPLSSQLMDARVSGLLNLL